MKLKVFLEKSTFETFGKFALEVVFAIALLK